jgi:DNA-binding NtrC family response regulator
MSVDQLRVLVVDDEQELVDALVERLQLRGIEAEGVTTGSAALARLEAGGVDVVLLDVKMPAPGGLDVLRKVSERWPNVAAVLVTGHGSTQDAETGMRLGASEYIMKPFDIDALVGTMLKAADAKGAQSRD